MIISGSGLTPEDVKVLETAKSNFFIVPDNLLDIGKRAPYILLAPNIQPYFENNPNPDVQQTQDELKKLYQTKAPHRQDVLTQFNTDQH
jgi:hypothetical protein